MSHAWERRERVYKVLVGKPEGRRPLLRPRRRWEDRLWGGRGGEVKWLSAGGGLL
jgi:hypothetical protein